MASSPWGNYTSYKLGGELTLNYNAATRELSTPRVLVINTNLGAYLSTDTRLIAPVLSPFTAKAATPRTAVTTHNQAKPSGIYDLTGRRYSSTQDLQPGFYIINGEKRLIVK